MVYIGINQVSEYICTIYSPLLIYHMVPNAPCSAMVTPHVTTQNSRDARQQRHQRRHDHAPVEDNLDPRFPIGG